MDDLHIYKLKIRRLTLLYALEKALLAKARVEDFELSELKKDRDMQALQNLIDLLIEGVQTFTRNVRVVRWSGNGKELIVSTPECHYLLTKTECGIHIIRLFS